jgi:hypothetical protein
MYGRVGTGFSGIFHLWIVPYDLTLTKSTKPT